MGEGIFFLAFNPGRRSCSRLRMLRRGQHFAPGYYLSGLQPFQAGVDAALRKLQLSFLTIGNCWPELVPRPENTDFWSFFGVFQTFLASRQDFPTSREEFPTSRERLPTFAGTTPTSWEDLPISREQVPNLAANGSQNRGKTSQLCGGASRISEEVPNWRRRFSKTAAEVFRFAGTIPKIVARAGNFAAATGRGSG